MFICKVCGLPIRNHAEAERDDSEHFICAACEVCDSVSQPQIDRLRADLFDQLSWIIERLYRYTHMGESPPPGYMDAIRERLDKQSNPADKTIESITHLLEPKSSDEDLLRQVAESERILAGFYYLSGERYTHANSNTVLRHWVALINRMALEVKKHPHDYDFVLKSISKDRYELGLARLARLIGDNPITIDRNPEKYTPYRKDHLLGLHKHDHIPGLIEQTECMKPKITGRNLKEVFRFAGNACFITEHDQVIEFRDKETGNLCKYLLEDQILIVINDLGFLTINARNARDGIHLGFFPVNGKRVCDRFPLAELVTIYYMEPIAQKRAAAAEQLTTQLVGGRYLPNCVYLPELRKLLKDVDAVWGLV